MWALRFDAICVEIQGMVVNIESPILGHFLLAFFNLCIVKFLHAAALHADKMIVMAAFIQFKYCLATFKMMPYQNAGLLKLRQYPVYGCETNISVLVQQQFVDVFRRHMALCGILK